MNKVAILIFALAISHAYGQAACEADLGTWLGVTLSANPTPAALGATLDTCVSRQSYADACCTEAQVTGIKTATETLQGTLEDEVGDRDQAIIDARAAVAAQRANFTLWLVAAAGADTVLEEWETNPPAQNAPDAQDITDARDAITSIGERFANFFNSTLYTALRNGFTTYQKARATCITAMLKEQVAAKCLACLADDAYTANGIVSTSGTPNTYTISYSDDMIDRMEEACAPYLTASTTQTDIFFTEQYAAGLEDMITALNKIADEDVTGVSEFLTAAEPATLSATPSTVSSCTATACTWIENTLFANGQLDTAALVRGGDDASTRRRLAETRMLQTDFDPDVDTEVKFTITFPENPGEVVNVNDLSALRVGVLSCIVAFFVALLI